VGAEKPVVIEGFLRPRQRAGTVWFGSGGCLKTTLALLRSGGFGDRRVRPLTEHDLRELFAPYGVVDHITIMTDRETGQPRGFGFVEMANDKAAHKELTDRIKPEVNLDLVGEYTNDLLGKLSVRMNGTEMVVDVGEWQSPAVKKIERDGSEKLLTTAPARRLEFAVGPRTLTLKMPQQEYAFAKAGAAAAP